MALYKIMIVDDEAEIRHSIARRISWEKLGFSVVAEAENGQDALEKAELAKPDIVLTDIKMPFMDGLSLARRLTRLYPAIRILILTGFDEFEYAKEAVGLGVEEYILKPVNEAELTAILSRIRVKLDGELERKRNAELLREKYEKTLPILREHFLYGLLSGTVPEGEIKSGVDSYGVSLELGRQKNVMVFDIESRSAGGSLSSELLPTSVRQLAIAQLAGRCYHESCISLKSVVVMTAWEQDNPISDVMSIATEICNECRSILDLTVTAGVGRCKDTLAECHRSYEEACEAIEYKAIVGGGGAIYIQDMENRAGDPVEFGSQAEKRLLSAVKFGTEEQIAAMVDDIMTSLRDKNRSDWRYQAYLIGVLNSIAHIIQRYEIDEELVLGEGRETFFGLGSGYTEEELRGWLKGVFAQMNVFLASRRVSMEKRLVVEAERYIAENYADSTLSVDSMCERLHLSRSYFSTIFKRGTGNSYINYLTEVRMKKAVELLENSEDKTYTIAHKVGYEEPNYFSYVFKKHLGVSPTQYRSANR